MKGDWSLHRRRSLPIDAAASRSADFQSAVSPICNRQACERKPAVEFAKAFKIARPAGCKPAIRQIKNLRYVFPCWRDAEKSEMHPRSLSRFGWKGRVSGQVLTLLIVLGSLRLISAQPVMTYIYHAPESSLDKRYLYHWEILRTALEKTKDKYGLYNIEPSEFMTEKRQAFELEHATGKLTVMYLSTTPEFEKNLIPIRIPVDRNLGGYCIFLIRKENQTRFRQVTSLEDLRKFSYGLVLNWIDVDILKSNNFNVVTGSFFF